MKRHGTNRRARGMDRREWMRLASWGVFGAGLSGWLPAIAPLWAADPARRRRCILLWMAGGPSQLDTFDMKPGHANGGEFREVATAVPGLRFCEHLPLLAEQSDRLAVLRGLTTKEGDHVRGTYLVRTGQRPGGPVSYPAIGASLAKSLGSEAAELPNYVSIAPFTSVNEPAFGSGFLGPAYAPTVVGDRSGGGGSGMPELGVDYLKPAAGVAQQQAAARLELWDLFQRDFLAKHQGGAAAAHDTVYRRAVRMMRSEAVEAFDLSNEPEKVREAYGRSRFGQGCLMARRLIERDVPLVEVALTGEDGLAWDTHEDNFRTVADLCRQLDAGWGTLMRELDERGLLDSTTILWIGEFGRTPQINDRAGRDHFPNAWSCVFAGGGIRGGQAHGRTSADGTVVEEGQVEVQDVLATLCRALGVDPGEENLTDQGRPIRLVEGTPIDEVLA